jgi:hypothetical protein
MSLFRAPRLFSIGSRNVRAERAVAGGDAAGGIR